MNQEPDKDLVSYVEKGFTGDYTPHILLLTFFLLVLMGILIYSDYDKGRVNRGLETEERELERVEWEAKAERCFTEAYSSLYVLGDELQTDQAENSFWVCLR